MDLIALYNTLQKLITPESNTSSWHASAELLWPTSLTLKEDTSEHTAAALQRILIRSKKKRKEKDLVYIIWNRLIKSHLRSINNTCVMSKSRVDTYGLSQWHFLMLCAAGSCRLPVLVNTVFPAGFSFKALRWAFKRLLRQQWRPPSDFPFLSLLLSAVLFNAWFMAPIRVQETLRFQRKS